MIDALESVQSKKYDKLPQNTRWVAEAYYKLVVQCVGIYDAISKYQPATAKNKHPAPFISKEVADNCRDRGDWYSYLRNINQTAMLDYLQAVIQETEHATKLCRQAGMEKMDCANIEELSKALESVKHKNDMSNVPVVESEVTRPDVKVEPHHGSVYEHGKSPPSNDRASKKAQTKQQNQMLPQNDPPSHQRTIGRTHATNHRKEEMTSSRQVPKKNQPTKK